MSPRYRFGLRFLRNAWIDLGVVWGVALLLTAGVLAMREASEPAPPSREQALYPTTDPTP